MNTTALINTFIQRAQQVSAFVWPLKSRIEAFEKCVSLALKKQPCSKKGPVRIAAPDMQSHDFIQLEKMCRENGIDLVEKDIRQFENGIDIGVAFADFGIAETGTLVVSSDSEDKRLATMISEINVILIHETDVRESAVDLTESLKKLIQTAGSYTAFITGASRTADIERVLALGVHGPLELHIAIVSEGK